ncbi:hypothetical protein U27_02045 [Candidatus Vecturithrix granuli]|uniref:DUF433 domain-containing protein n=1 Tax=Vecturithrix granuli TaxID=1499967 RepID=A0A0S6W6H2_VECG1|nr:hypothetical protein U27_02045 [Candidatus Vecturithrix granuli]
MYNEMSLYEGKYSMRNDAWQAHIVIDQSLHHGDPCIRGTRIPVSIIIGSLADGLSLQDIQTAYPQISTTDIHAALAYAAQVVRQDIFAPFPITEKTYAY